jgi:hypothetical protein
MVRSHRWSCVFAVTVLATLTVAAVHAQDALPLAQADDKPPPDMWLVDRSLVVAPKAEPVPALKFRLFPLASERKAGDAAAIYLRLAHERNDATKKMMFDKTDAWNELPLDKLPVKEARAFIDSFRYNLRQMELAARRQNCDWQYTLDVDSIPGGVRFDIIDLLLPDVQEMRLEFRMLALKARVEIAEGKPEEALRTIETGLSFSRQVAGAPFIISCLVGLAGMNQFTDCVLELQQRAEAPNLYWALAALPRPVIDFRKALEYEQRFVEMQFPELADLDRPRLPEEWDATLKRLRQTVERLEKQMNVIAEGAPARNAAAEAIARAQELPAARKYLTEKEGMSEARVAAMPPAEALLRAMMAQYKDHRDERFKAGYLPYSEARSMLSAADKRLGTAPDNLAVRLARVFMPAVKKADLALGLMERKIAAQRVVEALRMHAAAHDGQLPEKLEQITAVPVPTDPLTGKAFEYHRDGAEATLISRLPDESTAISGLRLRIKVK